MMRNVEPESWLLIGQFCLLINTSALISALINQLFVLIFYAQTVFEKCL